MSLEATRSLGSVEAKDIFAGNALLRVVAIGGGTGLSTLLRGLKHHALQLPAEATPEENEQSRYTGPERRQKPSTPEPLRRVSDRIWISDLSAVVTVTDDGGSSGRLRKEFNILPPGDIRNCLVALSEDEALLSRLFQYRFNSGEGLEGHSFGNLFLTVLSDLTGDFAEAVRQSSIILATRGQIF
ncbi:MAG TPA: gluconeogenesis factor YvcK family protein, partial [Terriglobales bacterium]